MTRLACFDAGNVAFFPPGVVESLQAGGMVIFPTDTLYGLGVDPRSKEGLRKLLVLKSREGRKPIPLLLDRAERAPAAAGAAAPPPASGTAASAVQRSPGSTGVRASEEDVVLLREGVIPFGEITDILKKGGSHGDRRSVSRDPLRHEEDRGPLEGGHTAVRRDLPGGAEGTPSASPPQHRLGGFRPGPGGGRPEGEQVHPSRLPLSPVALRGGARAGPPAPLLLLPTT